jgi:DNA-binding transcriptional LysR family regulator
LTTDWDHIRIFLCVARAGQFLAAARRLRVDHGTVSRKISALEASLGLRLFERQTTGCVLSPAGERLLASAELVEEELRRAHSDIAQLGAQVSSIVRMGVSDGFGAHFVSGRLGKLKSQQPALTVQLVPLSPSVSLPKHDLDIAIVLDRPKEGRLIVRKLVDYSLHFYASINYLNEHGMPRAVADLKSHHNVTYVHELLVADQLNFMKELYGSSYSRIECSSAESQLAAVRGGAGIGILDDYAVHQEPQLQIVLPDIAFERTYWIVAHADSWHRKNVRAVSDFILTEAKDEKWTFRP